jgi:tetratricopeptide (TPR) repeat protein
LAVAPNSSFAHYVKGQILRAQSRYEEAIFEYETAIALDRNLASAYGYLAKCKLATGSLDEVIPLAEHAVRLSPHDPNRGGWYSSIGFVQLLQSRVEEAILWLERARSAFRLQHAIPASLAAAYALKGDKERAAAALGEARKLTDLYSSVARLKATPAGWQVSTARLLFAAPELRDLAEPTFFAGLRLAGLPEE